MNALPAATELHGLHQRAQEWASVLRLPFRQQRWRGHSGEFMGAGVGSSMDFQDHRAYVPGDDPRQINWQAYARTGTYTLKQYREEVRPWVDLILDASDSMSAYPAKAQRVLELVHFTLQAAWRAGATVRAHLVKGAQHQVREGDALLTGHWQTALEEMPATAEPPELSRLPLRAGALRVCITDLLFSVEPERLLTPLGQRGGRGILLVPYAVEEAAPEWDGNYEFQDAETPLLQEQRIDPDLLRDYLRAYARHFDLWKSAAAKHGIALARLPAEADFIPALRMEGIPTGAVEVG